jgi:hypothetical protein
MGRVLGLVAAALVLMIGGLALAVYLTRDENNIEVDNILSENFSKAVALAEDPENGTRGIVDLRAVAPFAWDRVLLVAPGTPRAVVSRRLGRPWTGLVGIDAGELLIFLHGDGVGRFANYRGRGRFAGFPTPIADVPRARAVFRVRALVVTPAG